MRRPLLTFIFAATLSIAVAPGQSATEAPAAPQKPYRDRLLERALHGDADAQYELGKNYEAGRIGLPKDLAQAQRWYREGAAQGEPYSEFALGVLFNFGKGVKVDYVQAYTWYERAALHTSGGDRDSIVEMRDRVAGKMTQQQLAEAKKAADEWKPARQKPLVRP
jgi:TPR repeat protein